MTNKNFHIKTVISVLLTGFFIFLAFGSNESKTDNESNKNTDCSNKKEAYTSGYASGSLCRTMGDYSSCESYVQKYNYETGRDILVASDCYCEGFNDGKDGNPKKYNSDAETTNSNNNYSYSDDYEETDIPTTDNKEEQNTLEEINANSSNDKNSNSIQSKPKYKIYDLGYSINYDKAESECISRKMRLPDYNELIEISNSPELVKMLKANDKSKSYWSSTDYIDGQPFVNKESIQGDEIKEYKKNYNPFTEKTIMTDTRLTKNCTCIEKLDDNIYTVTN